MSRDEVLARAVETLAALPEVVGIALVGSGATGFRDEHSDLDLAVAVEPDAEPEEVARRWLAGAGLPVVHHFEDDRGVAGYLVGILLRGGLELDVGFTALDDLVARDERRSVLVDRDGALAARLERVVRRDLAAAYRGHADGIWHWLRKAGVALARGEPGSAVPFLDEVRRRAAELAALRGVDLATEQTLPRSLEPVEVGRALRAAADAFFTQARALDEATGLDIAARIEPEIDALLDRLLP